jgi:hypothetical protein
MNPAPNGKGLGQGTHGAIGRFACDSRVERSLAVLVFVTPTDGRSREWRSVDP